MDDDWLADEIRARSAMFWARGKAGMWPVEVQGHVLLATAILEVGGALFSDWTGEEPALWFVPALDGSRPYFADGHDAVYAGVLLAQYRPDLFAQICRRKSRLVEEEWSAAEDVYRTHIQTPRALAAAKMAAIHKLMTEALANGELASLTRTNGAFQPVPAEHWIDESVAYARFIESQMDPRRPDIQNWPKIDQVPPFAARPTVVPGNDWIFLTRDSLDTFKRRMSQAKKTSRETRPFAASQLQQLFKDFMAANPLASRETWVEEAKRHFPGSGNAGRDIWKANTPTGGRKSGRKTRH